MTVVAAPENQTHYDMAKACTAFAKGGEVVIFTACLNEGFNQFKWQIPTKSFVEKNGTFVNFQGREQKIKTGVRIIPASITLDQMAAAMFENLAQPQALGATL